MNLDKIRNRDRVQVYFAGTSALWQRSFHLPPWQRGFVWTDEQILGFHRRLLRGIPFGPVLIWERACGGEIVRFVLDGQQRMAALGVPLIRGAILLHLEAQKGATQ